MILSLFIPSGELLLLLLDFWSFESKLAGFGSTCTKLGCHKIATKLYHQFHLVLLPLLNLFNLIVEIDPRLEMLHLLRPVRVRLVYNSMPDEVDS